MHTHAHIEWQAGQPYATDYSDVYFSTDANNPNQGVDETHYVFLEHNQLTQRWQSLTPHGHFTIAETGFGTGLNFVSACQLWLKTAPADARLHFISVEKHPLSLADLMQAHDLWQVFKVESQALIAQYEIATEGFHRFNLFDNRVILTLLIGDVNALLPTVIAKVDAWFLDGFSPAKNPDMWQQNVFNQMAKLSHANTTFATFTSAGFVKRGLEAAGFSVKKAVGYGRKREMLFGHFATDLAFNGAPKAQQAVVIGGGIAGCSTAYALAVRGVHVTLIERHNAIAQEASGNPAGVLYPRLASHATAPDQLSLHSFMYTLRLLRALNLSDEHFKPCGLLQLAFNARETKRLQEIAQRAFLPSLLSWQNAFEASEIAGIALLNDALYFPQAGWVNPQAFCLALTQHANITVKLDTEVLTLKQVDDHWQVFNQHQLMAEAPVVVLANANDAVKLTQSAHLPLSPVRGQMTSVESNQSSLALKSVVCTEGYLTPAIQNAHCLGATFAVNEWDVDVRTTDNQINLAMLKHMAPTLETLAQQPVHGRAALRCATPDYMPLVGALIDAQVLMHNTPKHLVPAQQLPWLTGLYVNVGHGAKGLITAPYCAEILASQINQEPLPVDIKMSNALEPNRYLLKQLGLKRLISACSLRYTHQDE